MAANTSGGKAEKTGRKCQEGSVLERGTCVSRSRQEGGGRGRGRILGDSRTSWKAGPASTKALRQVCA